MKPHHIENLEQQFHLPAIPEQSKVISSSQKLMINLSHYLYETAQRCRIRKSIYQPI